jgi:hypothetical protein
MQTLYKVVKEVEELATNTHRLHHFITVIQFRLTPNQVHYLRY